MLVGVIVALIRIAIGIVLCVLIIKFWRIVFHAVARWFCTKILKRDDNFFSTRD